MARHSSPHQRTASPLSLFSFELTAPTFGAPALAGAGVGGLDGGSGRSWPPAPSAPRPASRPGHGAQTSAFVSGDREPGPLPAPPTLPTLLATGAPTSPAPAGRCRPDTGRNDTGRPETGRPATGRTASTPHRRRAPATGGFLRGRLAVAAVAAGALATAGHSLAGGGIVDPAPGTVAAALALRAATGSTADTDADTAGSSSTTATPSTATSVPTRRASAGDAATTDVLPTSPVSPVSPARSAHAGDGARVGEELGALSKSRRLADAAAARDLAARAPDFVRPAEGRFTSGFGARWGTTHKGVDIANGIGTPIVSAGDGTVIEAGPASGFGQWVRVRLEDGTINVYGHVNRFFVTAGQKVTAGEEIAEIGNRGHSTGPHLHFEVWTAAGTKINPLPWLAERGISLGAGGAGASD